MALVVLLKGVNVGGHRTFRPSVLARQLKRFGVVNVGAAGTFVIRASISRTQLRAELSRRLPFDADIMLCSGREITRLAAGDPFRGLRPRPGIVRFVSVLAKRRQPALPVPRHIPSNGPWCVRILTHQDRFVIGLYRRQMRTIGCLGQLERIFGVPVTTRNWNTILAVARLLEST